MSYSCYVKNAKLKVENWNDFTNEQKLKIIKDVKNSLSEKIPKWNDSYIDTLEFFLNFNINENEITFSDGSVGKAYYLDVAIEKLISVFARNGLKLIGSFVLIGEEPGDVVKWKIENNELILVSDRITSDRYSF